MKIKTYIAIVCISMGLVLLGYGLFAFFPESREHYVSLPDPIDIPPVSSSSVPARLIIPSVGINTKVDMVGKSASGAMAVPKSYSRVGWYKYGAIPGQPGNAVMAGHVDTGFGQAAVFQDLQKLEIGSIVQVINTEGATSTFTVQAMERYPYDDAPREKIFGSSPEAHLNLITCDGSWDPIKKIYSDRLVIYATLKGI